MKYISKILSKTSTTGYVLFKRTGYVLFSPAKKFKTKQNPKYV